MIFYISNTKDRTLGPTGVLHVTPSCSTLGRSDRRGWEATPAEIAAAYTLCAVCAPQHTGSEDPTA